MAGVKRTDAMTGFRVLPRRWVVERTSGWRPRYRRLRRDDAYLPERAATRIHLAMRHRMLGRLVGK